MSRVSTLPVKPKISMPTEAQLKKAYGSIVEAKFKAGVKPMAKAPANAEKYPHLNVTPKGLLGVSREVYVIKGHLYAKTHVVAPNAPATWYDCGRTPLF